MKKMIVENSTKEIKYIFDINENITIKDNKIITENFIIDDLNSSNASLIIDVIDETIPEDYTGCKYLYDESKKEEINKGISLNSKFIEKEILEK